MLTLILPDIHDKITLANYIISLVPHDRRIFLGDFFDDFPTDETDAYKTALQVRQWLNDPNSTVLLGNHDMSYGWGWKRTNLICSGWTRAKSDAIHSVLSPADWHKFKLAVWLEHSSSDPASSSSPRRPWLISHAGFHPQWIPIDRVYGYNLRTIKSLSATARRLAIDNALSAARTALLSYSSHGHVLLSPGWARGGGQVYGGINWLDWENEFVPIPGINQLVGHTPSHEPRAKSTRSSGSSNICLDTHLKHYALYDSSTHRMEVGAIKDLPGAKEFKRMGEWERK